MGDYDALRPDEVDRLERFAAAFDDLDPLVYETFGAGQPEDEALEPARAAAVQAIGSGQARRNAVKAAVRRFVDTADSRIAERHGYTGLLQGGRFAPPRPGDRAHALMTLERAVVGAIVWDQLTLDERVALLGPWGPIAESALEDA